MTRAKWLKFAAAVALTFGNLPAVGQQVDEVVPPKESVLTAPLRIRSLAVSPAVAPPIEVEAENAPDIQANAQLDDNPVYLGGNVYLDDPEHGLQGDPRFDQGQIIDGGTFVYDQHGRLVSTGAPLGVDGEYVCDECVGHQGLAFAVGVEGVYVRPQFESNPAFTTVLTDGSTYATVSQTEFTYDYEITPRIWVGIQSAGGLGVRGSYWQFDHGAPSVTTTTPVNGFIEHPSFGGIDIAPIVPGARFTASTELQAYAFDLDVTTSGTIGNWDLVAGLGVRYADIHQGYRAEQRLADGTFEGSIFYSHRNSGIGPSLTLASRKPLVGNLALFFAGRASLLYGDATSVLTAVEAPYLGTPFTVNQRTDRDDLLPIGEIKLGLDWVSPHSQYGRFFVRGAFEAQLWSGAGNASSEVGDLGFFGATTGAGWLY
jgi:hypothetical protein